MRFEALYAAHARGVLAFAPRRTTQPDDATDVLAETFLVAWRRLDVAPAASLASAALAGGTGVSHHNPGVRPSGVACYREVVSAVMLAIIWLAAPPSDRGRGAPLGWVSSIRMGGVASMS